MLERKRERKKIYPPQPPVALAVAGGEATISKEHLRIKMPSQPPLGDFKTRSYLNYTASIPLHFNKATGYYEPAEVVEMVKAQKYGYFYIAEPTPLADSGWAEQRVNKRRQSMSAIYDEDGTHLNFVPFPTRKAITIAGRTFPEDWGSYRSILVSGAGEVYVRTHLHSISYNEFWKDTSVSAGAVSPSINITSYGSYVVYLYSSTANTITMQISDEGVVWYDYIDFVFSAGERKVDIHNNALTYVRFKSASASIVTAIIRFFVHG